MMPRKDPGANKVNSLSQASSSKTNSERKTNSFSTIKMSNFGFKRRGKMEIISEILQFCSDPKSKTRIMYAINLNYARLKNYLELLTTKELLSHDSGKYVITKKGCQFLETLADINGLMSNHEPDTSKKRLNNGERI